MNEKYPISNTAKGIQVFHHVDYFRLVCGLINKTEHPTISIEFVLTKITLNCLQAYCMIFTGFQDYFVPEIIWRENDTGDGPFLFLGHEARSLTCLEQQENHSVTVNPTGWKTRTMCSFATHTVHTLSFNILSIQNKVKQKTKVCMQIRNILTNVSTH